jgi:hypothetical protein
MSVFSQRVGIITFVACILAACGTAPSPTLMPAPLETEFLPTIAPNISTPLPSRTPLPPPTRRITRTPGPPPTLSTSVFATFAALLTQRAPAEATRRAQAEATRHASCTPDDETMISPKKDWAICGGGGNFKVFHHNAASWQFSAQDQFGVEYYGDFRLIHWTADEKFLYFALMNPLDGPGPITSNAEALFRMDLSTGKVITILGSINNPDPSTQSFYVVSLSPTSRRLAYSENKSYFGDVPPQKKLYLIDLQSGEEKTIPIETEYSQIGSFVWSENGQLLTYTLYTDRSDDMCKYVYSVRLLNLTTDDSIAFIKNETIDECTNPRVEEFEVVSVSTDQVILKKGDEQWTYDIELQKLKLEAMVTPTP